MKENGIIFELWMDNQAEEAANFYINVFGNSELNKITNYIIDTPSNKPVGSVITVDFTLRGHRFQTLNGGPEFKLNPAVSFLVNFDSSRDTEDVNAKKQIDIVWEKLIDGGKILMPIDEYPFSKRYGWVQDKFGVSWQLILTNPEGDERPEIVPSLLFVGEKCGKAEEAVNFYTAIFKDSKKGGLVRYPAGSEPDKEGTVMFADFKLLDTWFAVMDSAHHHEFDFNEAVSFIVECKDQSEIDYYWEKLSAVPEAEACGWCKDKYGVSWQIVPAEIDEILSNSDLEKAKKAWNAILDMKKIDLSVLKAAVE